MRVTAFLFLLFLLFSCQQGQDFEVIGEIEPKSALEIKTSDLWIGGEVLDRDLCDYDAYKEYLGKLGAKKIRLQSGWAKTEKEKGVYDFAWLDHIVDDAISRGVQPWIQISYGNPIYPGGGGVSLGQGLVTSDEALEAFARYAFALVSRYKDRVNEWEIWNEANLSHNKKLGHDEKTYGKMFLKTVEAVKKAQPDATIVALSLAGTSSAFVDGFFTYLQSEGKTDWLDVITFHGYPRNPDEKSFFEAVEQVVTVARKYNPNIEFWQGETGCPSTFGTTGALRGYPWTEHSQAKWDLRRALAHIGRGYPFSLFLLSEFVYNDELRKGLNSKGILKIDESDFSIQYAKPAYYAYQNLCSVFGQELELVESLNFNVQSDSSLSVFAWKGTENRPMVAYWKDDQIPSDQDDIFEITLELEGVEFNNPVLVNSFNGEVKSIPKSNIEVRKGDVMFTTLPAYDSPFLLVEKSLIKIQ
jgi:hypothetical protein